VSAPECLLPSLYRIASRCGLRITRSAEDPLSLAKLILEELSRYDDDTPTGVTLEDVLLLEDCVVSSIEVPEEAKERPLRFEELTPLARFYYTYIRGITPEEYDRRREELSSEEEDERFAEFAYRLGRRFTAGMLRSYLSHLIDTIERYGFGSGRG